MAKIEDREWLIDKEIGIPFSKYLERIKSRCPCGAELVESKNPGIDLVCPNASKVPGAHSFTLKNTVNTIELQGPINLDDDPRCACGAEHGLHHPSCEHFEDTFDEGGDDGED